MIPRKMVRLLLVSLAAAGCGPERPQLHPVRGTVLVDGTPAEGATVVFDPPAGAAVGKPAGSTDAAGKFTLTTYPHGDGAPAGDYTVLVTWHGPNARTAEHAKNKLPAKYADATRTPLPKVTVRPGPNELEPFPLKSK